MDELRLIQKTKKGDSEAFGELYNKYIKKIYNFIYYKTYHQEIAEDLTSITFTKALERIESFNETQSNFSTWLYTIARNGVIDYFRTEKDLLNIDDVWDLTNNDDFEVNIDNKIKLESLREYLKNLNAEKREIIILKVWEGLNYQEIAEIIGKSENNCKMIFSRTIRKLRIEMPLALFILLLINRI